MTDCTHQELAIHPDGFVTCLVCGNDLLRKVESPVPLIEGELCLTHWIGKEHLVSYVVPMGIIRRVATRHVLVAEDGSEEPLELQSMLPTPRNDRETLDEPVVYDPKPMNSHEPVDVFHCPGCNLMLTIPSTQASELEKELDEVTLERNEHLADLHRQGLNVATRNTRILELEKAAADALSDSDHHERCPQSSCEGPCGCWRSFLVSALASPDRKIEEKGEG